MLMRFAWLPLLIASALLACPRPTKPPTAAQVSAILQRGAPWAEDTFYACLLNGLAQGLPFKQIQDDCETKLTFQDKGGFGKGDILGPFARGGKPFDPASLSGSCHTGDPRIAGSKVESTRVIHQDPYGNLGYQNYGNYSSGGEGKCGANFCYKNLSEDEARQQKLDAIREFERLYDEWKAADDAAKADSDNAALQAAAAAAKEAAEQALKEAQADPNKKQKDPSSMPVAGAGGGTTGTTDPSPGRTTTEESDCEAALREARELVTECHRTGWHSFACQQLWAAIHWCPNPATIYVDPDAGYACAAPVDPKTVRDAWVEKCRELKRPTPGGPDPCEPPEVGRFGRFVTRGNPRDICTDPRVRIDPYSPECIGELKIPSFAPDIGELVVWGMNNLGGPIVVLNTKNPDPKPGPPGPEPTPAPNTRPNP